ncbi:MAG TPA: coiled-coil domain-containing protein [Methylotenera sp.]
MSAITFDTLKFVKQLEASGIPAVQAEAFVNAQRDILSEALDTSLATRVDMLTVKADIERLDAKFDAKFDKMQWMLGIVIALAIANFAKQFF